MSKNVVFYFSGTGNSLQVAKEIANAVGDCSIISMRDMQVKDLEGKYERIGFVFPTYCGGVPLRVREFIPRVKLAKQRQAYFFAVATCGQGCGNALAQVEEILAKKKVKLNYGASIKMFSNYICLYPMSKKVEEITAKATRAIKPIMSDIVSKKEMAAIPKGNIAHKLMYTMIRSFPKKDKHYVVSDSCSSCGICKSICPVQNIEMDSKKPRFKHKCEQCMACIQFCPKQAINYKNKTQKRGRYQNPTIKYKDLV